MKKFICEFGSKYFTCDCVTVVENAVHVPSSFPSCPPIQPVSNPADGVQPEAVLEVKDAYGCRPPLKVIKEIN